VYQPEREKAGGLWQALGELTTKTVQLLDASARLERGNQPVCEESPADDLRQTILEYRDKIGRTPHRDQLELCLFASKVLLEHSETRSKFRASADADLLLGFCRLALSPYQADSRRNIGLRSESSYYLRPYYDAVMRAKLRETAPRIKELIEIHAETTLGEHYVKPAQASPILAMYTLGGECYLILDLPHHRGKCVALSEMYDIDAIRIASESSEQGLPLPREIHQALVDWKERAAAPNIPVDLRWEDPLYGFMLARPIASDSTAPAVVASKPVVGRFPFRLPPGFGWPSGAKVPWSAASAGK
jgi:hypothetical protein